MKTILLTQDKSALVDDEDFETISQFKWYAQKGRYTFYAARRTSVAEGRKSIPMHNQILGCNRVDHIDGNGLNNQRSNLRPATNAQNLRNRGKQKNNTTGFKGVYFYRRRNVFQAYITVDGVRKTIGQFKTAEEAHTAYCAASVKFHGDFARSK